MLSLYYLGLNGRYIEDKEDFFRSGIAEISKVRNLCTICQRLFVTNSKNVNLFLLGDKDIYRLDINNDKGLVARVYYLPKELRLDLYDGRDPRSPLFMWKSKKCIYKNIPLCLEVIKIETMLLPLVSVT